MTTDSADALREEITRTRAQLGETVHALASKADVGARAKGAVADAAGRARDRVHVIGAHARGRMSRHGTGPILAADPGLRAEGGIIGVVRKPLPAAALAVSGAVIGLVIYMIRRGRS